MTRLFNNRDASLIALLGVMAAIGPLSIDTYLPGLPAIAKALGTSDTLVQQTVSAFFFGLAAGQLISGPLSDRFGRRPVLLTGFTLYIVASVVCAMAGGIESLIVARVVQGLAVSAPAAAGRAVIRDVWSGDHAARSMSFVMMITAFAPFIAPIIGSQIFSFLGWQAIFWFLVGYAIIAFVLLIIYFPETNTPDKRQGVRVSDSFRIYRLILKDIRVWGYLICGGFAFASLFAYITAAPFVYIKHFGINPEYLGYLLAINVVALTIGNWINARFVVRFGHLRMLGGGIIVLAFGATALMLFAVTDTGGFVAIMVALLFCVGPMACIGGNALIGLMNMYPKNAGAVAALFGVCQSGVGSLGGVAVGLIAFSATVSMGLTMSIMALVSLVAFVWLGFISVKNARTA